MCCRIPLFVGLRVNPVQHAASDMRFLINHAAPGSSRATTLRKRHRAREFSYGTGLAHLNLGATELERANPLLPPAEHHQQEQQQKSSRSSEQASKSACGEAMTARDALFGASSRANREVEVLGAYMTPCMSAPERRFLLRIEPTLEAEEEQEERTTTITTTTTSRVVELEVMQGSGGLGGRTGVSVWRSSLALLALLEAQPELVRNATVVELGAGTGLISIAAQQLGARRVLATDGNEEVLQLLQLNVDRQQSNNDDDSRKVEVRALRWGQLEADAFRSEEMDGEAADVILGSDLTYNPSAWRALLDTMEALSAAHTRVIYVSAAHPAFLAELRMFRVLAESSGFDWNELDLSLQHNLLSNENRSSSSSNELAELRAVELRLKSEQTR